nr:MAG TPA: hypothetical protein [Caudoviricetes sp.]
MGLNLTDIGGSDCNSAGSGRLCFGIGDIRHIVIHHHTITQIGLNLNLKRCVILSCDVLILLKGSVNSTVHEYQTQRRSMIAKGLLGVQSRTHRNLGGIAFTGRNIVHMVLQRTAGGIKDALQDGQVNCLLLFQPPVSHQIANSRHGIRAAKHTGQVGCAPRLLTHQQGSVAGTSGNLAHACIALREHIVIAFQRIEMRHGDEASALRSAVDKLCHNTICGCNAAANQSGQGSGTIQSVCRKLGRHDLHIAVSSVISHLLKPPFSHKNRHPFRCLSSFDGKRRRLKPFCLLRVSGFQLHLFSQVEMLFGVWILFIAAGTALARSASSILEGFIDFRCNKLLHQIAEGFHTGINFLFVRTHNEIHKFQRLVTSIIQTSSLDCFDSVQLVLFLLEFSTFLFKLFPFLLLFQFGTFFSSQLFLFDGFQFFPQALVIVAQLVCCPVNGLLNQLFDVRLLVLVLIRVRIGIILLEVRVNRKRHGLELLLRDLAFVKQLLQFLDCH